VEGVSVGEGSISPATVLARGRRAVHLLQTPLFTNAFYLWVSAAAAAVAGFAFWALVARLYNADDVGLGSAALSILTLLGMFSHLGLGLGLVRFLPESGDGGPRLANAVFTASAVGAVVLSIVFLIGVPLWAPRLGFLREQPLYALAFICFVVAATLYAVQTYAFLAIRKAKYILLQVVFIQLSRLALPALLVAFLGAFGIVVAWGMAIAIGVVVGFALLPKGLPGYRPRGVIDPPSVSRLFPFSVANYVADSLLLIPGLILPLVVVGLMGSAEAAYFYMAWLLGYLLTSASTYLALSLFAEGSHNPGALRILSHNAVLGGLAVAGVGAMFFLLLGDKLLLAFGRDYAAEGAPLLRIVALAALPAAVVNVYLGTLRVTKQVCELVVIAGVVAATTLALSSALLPVMGLTGAGIGHGLGQGLGLTIVMIRLLMAAKGTMPQRMRWLLVALAGRS
jgi:O-antigen/teichoic acid export membrane protein